MLAQLLFDTADRFPERTGLVYAGDRWTWAQLATLVRQLASGLAREGIGPQDHVALWLKNSPCFVASYFAVLARGSTAVPLNPDLKQGDFESRRIPFKAVISSFDLAPQRSRAMRLSDAQNETRHLVCPDPDSCSKWDLVDEDQNSVIHSNPGDRALLLFSSGSTAIPKPLYRTHGQCMAEVRHFRVTCATTEADTIFCALPLFHAHGMANALWAAVGSGATLVLMKNPQPFALRREQAMALLESERVTVFPGVPFMFQTLADARATADLSSVRLCFSAGNPLPRDVFDRFLDKFGIPVRQLYGCTEAGSVTINLDEVAGGGAETVGRPMCGIEIEVRDENGVSLPPGVTGEVVFRSPASTSGYAFDATANEPFLDGWFFSGDMGRIDTNGRLEIVGRKKFLITVAGHKVYAKEVEEVLTGHPAVLEAAVIGIPDNQTGEAIKAYLVTRSPLTESQVFRYCQSQLPAFKRPREVVFVQALPKTALGKIARNQLP